MHFALTAKTVSVGRFFYCGDTALISNINGDEILTSERILIPVPGRDPDMSPRLASMRERGRVLGDMLSSRLLDIFSLDSCKTCLFGIIGGHCPSSNNPPPGAIGTKDGGECVEGLFNGLCNGDFESSSCCSIPIASSIWDSDGSAAISDNGDARFGMCPPVVSLRML